MKRHCLALVLVLASACAPYSPIRLGGVQPLDITCAPPTGAGAGTETIRGQGTLDLAGSSSYLAAFNIASDLQVIDTTIGGDKVASSDRNDAEIHQIVLKYSSIPQATFPDEIFYKYFVLPPNTPSGTIFVNLIGRKAAAALIASVPAGGDPLQLFVTVQAVGNLLSGESISSNAVIFPITIKHSGACPANQTARVPLGTCGNPGQDNGGQTCQ